MQIDAKTTYAQSSDIKSRTYLEYRRDMKKKAIAEYETRDWLSAVLIDLYKGNIEVKKSGGDARLWFLRKGGVTREPDFEAVCNGKIERFEFQYADSASLKYYDFKDSKVGKKANGTRIPFTDKKFLYIVKPTGQYAFIEPSWIIENGINGVVAAWGNAPAYRVPHDVFVKILVEDKNLYHVIKTVDLKTNILNFAFDFLRLEESKLSMILQTVVDKDAIIKFIPKDLESFYRVCFIIDKLGETPVNANLWLIYLLTFFDDKLSSYQMAQLTYCIDFLYLKVNLQDNELNSIVSIIHRIKAYCQIHQVEDGRFVTSNDLSPKDETRNYLFIINLLEDLIQDSIFYYKTELQPINKIFETIQYIKGIGKIIEPALLLDNTQRA